jgi:hypothetical protein
VERLPEHRNEGIVRKDGRVTPFNAGDAVAALIDIFKNEGLIVVPEVRARFGKAAKALLEVEVSPEIVVAAMVAAMRTRMFGSVETIAQELMLASAGGMVGREEYRQALATTNATMRSSDSVVWQTMRAELERREERDVGSRQAHPQDHHHPEGDPRSGQGAPDSS